MITSSWIRAQLFEIDYSKKTKMETQHKPFKEDVPILSTIIFRLPLVTEKVDLLFFSRAPSVKS